MKNAITVRAVMAFLLLAALAPGASAAIHVSIERPAGYHHYDVLVNPGYLEDSW